jgi:hypothetical protein
VGLLTGDSVAIYLNDHLAGATAGLELARRAAANNRATEYGSDLDQLAAEIRLDRDTLEDVMARLGAGRDRVKLLAAWGAEKAGRLKLNGRLLGYSPLSRLEELELLLLGVDGKLALWRALRRTHGDDERLGDIHLDVLIRRAQAQHRRLERLRLRAADEALAA